MKGNNMKKICLAVALIASTPAFAAEPTNSEKDVKSLFGSLQEFASLNFKDRGALGDFASRQVAANTANAPYSFMSMEADLTNKATHSVTYGGLSEQLCRDIISNPAVKFSGYTLNKHYSATKPTVSLCANSNEIKFVLKR